MLYIAALFHDIGKGRGGDHSELGARSALAFCRRHGLDRYDSRLVEWLVRHHLLMSHTAQRRDISDPDVISEFARALGNLEHLDYLYLLTVADIRATNPNLWSEWKDALLRDLYFATRRALRGGWEDSVDQEALVAQAEAKSPGALRGAGRTRASGAGLVAILRRGLLPALLARRDLLAHAGHSRRFGRGAAPGVDSRGARRHGDLRLCPRSETPLRRQHLGARPHGPHHPRFAHSHRGETR